MKRTALTLALLFAAALSIAQPVNRVTGPGTIDVAGSSNVNTEGQKASYYAGLSANTPAATPTDVAILTGSATKTIKVTRVTVSVSATTGGVVQYQLVTRTGGTQSAVNTAFANGTHSGPFDSVDAASTVIAAGLAGVYTSNPASVGTAVGIPAVWNANAGTPATAGPAVFEYRCTQPAKCITLRGVTQVLAINGNSHALATAEKVGVSFEWTEE